jgi:hypothetical protein
MRYFSVNVQDTTRDVNGSGRIRFGSNHIILLLFLFDLNPTHLNSGKKILTHT